MEEEKHMRHQESKPQDGRHKSLQVSNYMNGLSALIRKQKLAGYIKENQSHLQFVEREQNTSAQMNQNKCQNCMLVNAPMWIKLDNVK